MHQITVRFRRQRDFFFRYAVQVDREVDHIALCTAGKANETGIITVVVINVHGWIGILMKGAEDVVSAPDVQSVSHSGGSDIDMGFDSFRALLGFAETIVPVFSPSTLLWTSDGV